MLMVNTLVLWVGVTCLAGYYLGIKLQLDDGEAWRTLAAYILWILVTKLAILLYCLAVRRSRRRCTRLGVGGIGGNASSCDDVNSVDVKDGDVKEGSGDVKDGDGGFSVLRESALLTLVLTANNTGMIGLPIMDATFGAPGRRLALLTGIPVMLLVVPFAVFAFEVHKVRRGEAVAKAWLAQQQQQQQQQQRRRRSNMSCIAKVDDSGGSDDGQGDGHGNSDGVYDPSGTSPALQIGNAHQADCSGGGADATKVHNVRRGGGRGSATLLRHRTEGVNPAAPAPAGAAHAADAQVLLRSFRRSADARILSSGGGSAAADTTVDATLGRSNTNTNNAIVVASASRAVSAPLEWSRGSRDDGIGSRGGIGSDADGGRMEDRRTTGSVPRGDGGGGGSGGHLEIARGSGGPDAPTDLALLGAGLLLGAVRAAAVAVAATAAAKPPPPPLPFQPIVSPFAAMPYVTAGDLTTGTGDEGLTAVRSVSANATVAMHAPRRSVSTGARRAAAAAATVFMPLRKSPAAPLPAALSLVSTPGGALYGSNDGAGRHSSSHDGGGGGVGSRATSYESHTAKEGTIQQPRKSVSGAITNAAVAASSGGRPYGTTAAPEPHPPSTTTTAIFSHSPPKPPLPPPQSDSLSKAPSPLRSRRRRSALSELRITTGVATFTNESLAALTSPPAAVAAALLLETSPSNLRTSDTASAEVLPISQRCVVVEEQCGEGPTASIAGGRTTTATATVPAVIGPGRRPSNASTNLSTEEAPLPHRCVVFEETDNESLTAVADGGDGSGDGAGGRTMATNPVPAAPAQAVSAADGAGTGIRQFGTAIQTVGKNPLLWSLLMSMVTNFSGLRKFLDPDSPSFVPELGFVPELLHWFASIAVPVSLVSIGVWMYGKHMPASLLKQAGTLLLIKVAVLPLLQAACALAVGLPAGPTLTLVLLALCPTATISFVVAAYFGYGTDVVSAVTLGGTILLVPAVLIALQLPQAMGLEVRLVSSGVTK